MLEVRDLVAGYGPVEVLHGMSMDVPPSGITALLGSNGAGKTTTLSVLAGLLPATAGSVRFLGGEMSDLSTVQRARLGMVLVPEGRHVFPSLRVEENLLLGSWPTGLRGRERRGDLAGVYDFFPRLAERRNQIAGTMSGGEQQMLAIGRGLMARPKLLMVDECSMGLAPIVVSELFERLEQLANEGIAVLAVEQNTEILLHAHLVYVMDQGDVQSVATADEARDVRETVERTYLGTVTEDRQSS